MLRLIRRMKSLGVTTQMKASGQQFPVVLFIRELTQPRRQRQRKRQFKNDFQIFLTSSR